MVKLPRKTLVSWFCEPPDNTRLIRLSPHVANAAVVKCLAMHT